MPDPDSQLDRMERTMYSLARDVGMFVQTATADRRMIHEALRELNGFTATAGIALDRLERQVEAVNRNIEAGFIQLQTAMAENNRQVVENNRRIDESNRRIEENNRRIDENIEAIRRLIEILRRGRHNGDAPPA